MEGIVYYDTLMEYYLGIEVSSLPDEVWALKMHHLLEIRKLEAKSNAIR